MSTDIQSFTDLFERMHAVAEHTRNNMVTHFDARTLTDAEQKQVRSKEGRAAFITDFLQSSGMHSNGSLYQITAEQARRVFRKILTDSAAYDQKPLDQYKESPEADAIVGSFFALCSQDALFATELENAKELLVKDPSAPRTRKTYDPEMAEEISKQIYSTRITESQEQQGVPLTDATFERGLLVLDKDKLVFAWFEEED